MSSFSVITVVFNDVTHIKETMDSVIKQSYKHIEYILIDGGSSDGTKEAIFGYISSCSKIMREEIEDGGYYLEAIHRDYPTLTFKFLSEKDRGIYDAMNKGIALATKEWINFMNCGDRFYNLEVLQKLSQEPIHECDVVYGDLNIHYLDQKIEVIKKTSHDLNKLYRLFYDFGHPNCFIKTKIHKENLFDQNYRLSADYELIYRLYAQKKRFKFLNVTIATFASGGASDKNAKESLLEALAIAKLYNNHTSFIRTGKIYAFYCYAIIKKIIKKFFPTKISRKLLCLIHNK